MEAIGHGSKAAQVIQESMREWLEVIGMDIDTPKRVADHLVLNAAGGMMSHITTQNQIDLEKLAIFYAEVKNVPRFLKTAQAQCPEIADAPGYAPFLAMISNPRHPDWLTQSAIDAYVEAATKDRDRWEHGATMEFTASDDRSYTVAPGVFEKALMSTVFREGCIALYGYLGMSPPDPVRDSNLERE